MSKQAMQQALEALDAGVPISPGSVLHDSIRAALAEQAQPVAELPPLPEHVATIGGDGHPRHVRHVWSALEVRHYGPPKPLFTADQMRDYARAVEAEMLKRMGVQR